MNDCGYVSNRN